MKPKKNPKNLSIFAQNIFIYQISTQSVDAFVIYIDFFYRSHNMPHTTQNLPFTIYLLVCEKVKSACVVPKCGRRKTSHLTA